MISRGLKSLERIAARFRMAMKSVPWTTLRDLKGDEIELKKLDEAESLLRSLRKALTSE